MMLLLKKTVFFSLPIILLSVVFLSLSSPAYAGCDIAPTIDRNYAPGSTIFFNLSGAKPSADVELKLIRITGGSQIGLKIVPTDSSGSATFSSVAPDQFGDYKWTTVKEPRDCTPNTGTQDGFTVGNPGAGAISFTTRPAQVTSNRTRIDITITGLQSNKCFYVSKVEGFTGSHVSQNNSPIDNLCSGNDILKSDPDGKLIILDICENMEGVRMDCEDPFDADGTYSFKVHAQPSGSTSFDDPEDWPTAGGTLSFAVAGGLSPDDTTDTLPGKTKEVVDFLINFGVGIAGGVAFLLLVYGGFKFIFSVGNPESIQQGREIITAAIIGLIVVVFSVFLLRLIGISILGLPI